MALGTLLRQIRILERQEHQRYGPCVETNVSNGFTSFRSADTEANEADDDCRTRRQVASGRFESRERQRTVSTAIVRPFGARRRNSCMVRCPNCEMRSSVITIRQGRLDAA